MPHELDELCLSVTPMTPEMVRQQYDDGSFLERILCLSHERLRHELAGAESLLDEGANKIARLEAEIIELRQMLASKH